MNEKRDSLSDALRGYLKDELAQGWGGLLDQIPVHSADGKPRRSDTTAEHLICLSRAPNCSEIDYAQTPDDLLLCGKAVLKDGSYVTW